MVAFVRSLLGALTVPFGLVWPEAGPSFILLWRRPATPR